MEQIFMIGTAVTAGASLLGAVALKKSDIVMDYLTRLLLGITAIYFINAILAMQSISSGVGINGTTAFIAGALGLPGILLTYGISFLIS